MLRPAFPMKFYFHKNGFSLFRFQVLCPDITAFPGKKIVFGTIRLPVGPTKGP